MQVQVARISPVMMEVAVEVPAADVKAEVEKVYSNLQKKARVRGFRPGKAPRQVLAHLYGPQVASDVVNAIVNETLPKALSDKNVQPINQPQVEPGKFDQSAPFSYKARFEVSPEIEEVSWEGLELSRPSVDVGEEVVNEQIEMLRKQHSRLEAPDPTRAAQKGDVVTIDFTLDADGKELKEGGGNDVQLELGSGGIVPELEAAITGKGIDAAFEVTTAFPAEHPREELRGKSATFHVKVKDIKERILPALDDELAKDVGNFQTLVELRADVHTRLMKIMKDRSDTALAEQIIEKLNERNQVPVPPTLVEQQCRMMEMELAQNARRMGQRVTQQDIAKVHGQVHADAEKKVRAGLLMAAIAKKLGIVIGDQDIQRGIQELAQETGKNVAKVRAEYSDPQRRQILLGMLMEDKVLDAIEAKAKITSPAEPAQKTETSGTAEPKEEASSAKDEASSASDEASSAKDEASTASDEEKEEKTESQESASKAKKKTKAKE